MVLPQARSPDRLLLTTSPFSISRLLRVEAEVGGPGDHTERFGTARDEVLGWLADAHGAVLPPQAWDGEAFDTALAKGGRIHVTSSSNPVIWLIRISEIPTKPGITVDIAIAQMEQVTGQPPSVRFALEISQIAEDSFTTISEIPLVITRVAARMGFQRDGRALTTHAEKLRTNDDVKALLALLENPARRLPVIVVSEDGITRTMMTDPDQLAAQLQGLAHVIAIPYELSRDLTDLAGKEWSVFRGAVRFYRTRLDRFSDSYRRHPLLMPQTYEGPGSEIMLLAAILRLTAASSVAERPRHGDLASFAELYAHITGTSLSEKLKQADTDSARVELLQAEVERLSSQIESALAIAAGNAARLAAVQEQKTASSQEEETLRNRLRAIETALRKSDRYGVADSAVGNLLSSEAAALPLQTWLDQHYAGRLHLTPQARAALLVCAEHEPVQLRPCLEAMATTLVDDLREDRQIQAYQARLRTLGSEDVLLPTGDLVERGDSPLLLNRALRLADGALELHWGWDPWTGDVVIGQIVAPE